MTVPDFQTIALPLLRLSGDGNTHRLSEAIEQLAREFQLTPEEAAERLPSGRQSRFANRVGWARTYLTRARLLESAQRGSFTITARGREVLAAPPDKVTVAYLRRFPELMEFIRGTKSDTVPAPDVSTQDATPEELIEQSHLELTRNLAEELLSRVKDLSPGFFENLVVDLLVRMGYGGSRAEAGTRLGRTGDGGVDGIIKEDKLGLDVVYVQAKRWDKSTVGRPEIQAFAGSLEGHRARKGVFITTARFSADARSYVDMIEKRIVLIDGPQLAEYMIEHDLGVVETAVYRIKRSALEELDYYEEATAASEPPATPNMVI